MESSVVARRFVRRINAHDVEGLIDLMSANHTFVDSLGAISARPAIEEGWKQYFRMVPDYRVKIVQTYSQGGTVILIGMAGGTYVAKDGVMRPENKWETPAVWIARVRSRKVQMWRVYSDNEPIRAKMGSSRS